jgi:hypothetical protein
MIALTAMRQVFGEADVNERRLFVKDGVDWISLMKTENFIPGSERKEACMAVRAQDTMPAQIHIVVKGDNNVD